MAQKSISGNKELAGKIKQRRNELNLTIEEAASRAGVGTKTWSRYEAGGSIRLDKCKGICKALNWTGILNYDEEDGGRFSVQECKEQGVWSTFLEDRFGSGAAMSFAIGSDILLDHIEEDMMELASMPIGTHIGQLSTSWLYGSLPEQFLMHYDYEFLYQMKCTLCRMRMCAKSGYAMTVNSVLEELLFYICCEEASVLIELNEGADGIENGDSADYEDWIFDLFGDMDVISCLYNGVYLNASHMYHFSHWTESWRNSYESER